MTSSTTRVLLVEDSRADARLMELALARAADMDFGITTVRTLAEASAALEHPRFDAVLLDLSLPDGQGIPLVEHAVHLAGRLPVVVMTGLDDDDVGRRAIAAGAQDYLVKGELDGRAVGRALHRAIDRQRMTLELAEHRQLLQSVLASTADAVVVVDPEGNVTLANPAAHTLLGPALLGDATETMDGWYLADAQTPCPGEQSPFTHAARGQSVDGEMMYVEHDGRARWLSANVRPLTLDGAPAGGVVALRDVTEARVADAQVATLNAELHQQVAERSRALLAAETASRLKQQFLDVVSHELRTPLTPILGYARLLLRRPATLEAGTRDALEEILAAGQRLKSVVERILDFRALRAQGVTAVPEACDLRGLLDRALGTARQVEGVTLVLTVAPAVPTTLWIDPELVLQVVAALVDNAVRYTPEGQVTVGADWEADGGRLTIEVADPGVGIDPAHLPHIFDAFYQAEPALTRARGGLGLGLAHARYLAEAMEGRLTVESTPGVGSRFLLGVPAHERDGP
ncbi:MAG: response regulator [Myxococcales bacterium]|nr:response regulator [Myxococcales bacterium]